jgi:hypothetical protein
LKSNGFREHDETSGISESRANTNNEHFMFSSQKNQVKKRHDHLFTNLAGMVSVGMGQNTLE